MRWCPGDSVTSEQVALLWGILRTIIHESLKLLGCLCTQLGRQIEKVLPGVLLLFPGRQNHVSRNRILPDQDLFPLKPELGWQADSLTASVAKELRRLCCCCHEFSLPTARYISWYITSPELLVLIYEDPSPRRSI